MKNIFKKNSIIITALAIMIVIAGYLSFTNRDTKDDKVADKASVEDVQAVEGNEVVTDTGTNDTGTTDTGTTDTGTTDTGTTDTGTNEDTDITDTGTEDTGTEDTTTEDKNASDELGKNDKTNDDALADAKDVSDNGELNLKDGTPGEAVLASTTIDSGYFVDKRLDREQKRAKDKATYMDIIQSAEATSKAKEKATDSILQLTQIADKESAAEILLEAKGFDDSIVFIVGEKADVVVNSAGLSKQQLAIIEDVVKGETDIAVKNIKIIPVVVSE